MVSDEELIGQIRQGKREAYGEVFRKYNTQIRALCLSILRDHQEAEEISQAAFVHAYLKLDQLKKPAKFLPWLKRIAQNLCRNYIERSKAKIVPLDFAREQTTNITPEEQLLMQEVTDAIMEAVELLPPIDREVVRARIDGLNHIEISERFGISVQASMNRLHRARKKLADHMKELLHGIFIIPRKLSSRIFVSGGVMVMKVGTGTKVVIGIAGIVAAILVGLQLASRGVDVQPSQVGVSQQTARQGVRAEPLRQVESPPGGGEHGVEDIEEFLAWLDNIESSAAVRAQKDLDEVASEQELSSELRERVELVNALRAILPVYEEATRLKGEATREAVDHVNSLDSTLIDTDLGSIHHGPDLEIMVLDKQGREIINDSYLNEFLVALEEKKQIVTSLVSRQEDILQKIDELHPGSVEWLSGSGSAGTRGLIQVDVLRGYLGKELPYAFRGYQSYSKAQDYEP